MKRTVRHACSCFKRCFSSFQVRLAQRSPFPDVCIPENLSLPEFIFNHIAQYGDRVALHDHCTGREITYGGLEMESFAFAGALQKQGLMKGEVVAIYSPNRPEFAPVFLGTALAGGILTSVNPTYTVKELAYQIKSSSAKYLVTIPPLVHQATAAGVPLQNIIVFGESTGAMSFAELVSRKQTPSYVPIDPIRDTLVLPYSSGTTSLPKGVQLTHYNVIANVCQVSQPQFLDYGTSDTIAGLLPFFHIYGMTMVLLCGLQRGARIVTFPKFEKEEFLRAMQEQKVTMAHLAPPAILFLTKHPMVAQYDLSHLRDIISGAAPLGYDLAEACALRLHCILRQGYGMTEMSPVSHLMPVGSCTKYSSVGRLVSNMSMKVVDLESGAELPVGSQGELLLKGPNVMRGYHNNPEATAAAFDADGFLRTGDVAYIDGDGDCYIVDRCKELIKVKGFQVAPAELEDILQTHPAVDDCGVIGVRSGGDEVPKAFVTLKAGHSPTPQLEEEIIEFAALHSAWYKRIREVSFVPQIPKSAAGKILRRELRDIHASSGKRF